jgi:hypothetical protein
MRIAEDGVIQQFRVLADLRPGVQSGAGVIEVNVTLGVEAPVFGGPKRVERLRRFVFWMRLQEFPVRGRAHRFIIL